MPDPEPQVTLQNEPPAAPVAPVEPVTVPAEPTAPAAAPAPSAAEQKLVDIQSRMSQAGWRQDDQGNLVAPAPPQREAPPSPPPQTAGVTPELRAQFATKLRMADLSQDPEAERANVMLEMADHMAQQRQRQTYDAIIPQTTRGVVTGYKEQFRNDPTSGEYFKAAEPEFDALVKDAEQRFKQAGITFTLDPEFAAGLRDAAIGRATPRIVTSQNATRTAQGTTAARVATGVTLAGASTGSASQPVALSEQETTILGRMAVGAHMDAAKLRENYAKSKRGV